MNRRRGFVSSLVLIILLIAPHATASRIGSYSELTLKTPLRVKAGVPFNISLDAHYRLDMRCIDTSWNSDSYGKVFFLTAGKATRRIVFTKTGQQTLHFECSPPGSLNDIWSAGKRIFVAN